MVIVGLSATADVVSLISTVGFPIAACIMMGLYIMHLTKNNRKDLQDVNDKHDTELKELTTAINNNTLVMQQILDRLNNNA